MTHIAHTLLTDVGGVNEALHVAEDPAFVQTEVAVRTAVSGKSGWVGAQQARARPRLAADIAILERKEGNVLFNDALNTFYLRLYGIRHMVKDQSESEKGRKEGRKCFI